MVSSGDLVGTHQHADQRQPLRDEMPVRILGVRQHLVEVLRLERYEQPALGHRVGGGHVRHGDDIDRDAASIGFLLEAADHILPPVRSISTLMPVRFSNSLAMYWPAATGVDVYQVTLPSRLAAASSIGSGLNS